MDLQQTQSVLGIVLSVVAIVGIPLGVYKFYVKDQQTDGDRIANSEKGEIILAKDIQLLRTEITGELGKMTAQFHSELRNMTIAFDHLKINDLHSILEKQKDQDSQINKLTLEIGKLTTIIDERVPRKTVEQVT